MRAVVFSIIKSPAVWAITATHVTQNFGYYVLLTELPTYMKNVLGWDLKDKVRAASGLKHRIFLPSRHFYLAFPILQCGWSP